MSRQEGLNQIWKRLILVLGLSVGICLIFFYFGGPGRVGVLVFVIGNIGGYVSVHRGLADLKDTEIIDLAASWWAIIAPPFVGGILALALYLLFLSNIVAGDLFPTFKPIEENIGGLKSLALQDGQLNDYAKLFFWSFVAGFNQKYVVDIIESVKAKP
ncbi:MAG: hypothetical protein AMJ53_05205 [Gammaproteobacteria bacterium SG8_11]|nr:MAG: hypothetical protein AMJ53_05205 [Gammaproteobacteria bacterium SG8_11]